VREKGRIEGRGFHSVRSEEPELEPVGSIHCTPHPHIQHLGTGPKIKDAVEKMENLNKKKKCRCKTK
jgi:hypothetical protein